MNLGGRVRRAAGKIAAAVSIVVVAATATAAEPFRAELSNRLSLGYDSFIDRFTIVDVDTANAIHDFYGALGNTLLLAKGSARLSLGNVFRFGNQTIDEAIDIDAGGTPSASWRIDMRGGFRYKHFRDRSDYAAANDYRQGNASLRVRKRVSDRFRAGVRGRLELVDFETRTAFDYDYLYRDAGLEIEAGSDYANMLRVSGGLGRRDAPDTTDLGFDRFLAGIEAHAASGDRTVHFALFADRRNYRGDTLSNRWNINSNFEAAHRTAAGGSIALRAETEILSYDRPERAYFSSQFVRGGLRISFPAGKTATVFAEPRYGQMLCHDDIAQERYREHSLVMGIDVFGRDGFWITASYEPGYRDYSEPENDSYSDFMVNRASVMGTLSLTRDCSINIFLNHEPEIHSRREDDFSITLVSIDLAWRF